MMDLDLRFYLAVFQRRLPYFLTIVITVVALGIAVAYLMPKTYRASARILLEAPQIPPTLASSTAPMNPIEQLQVVQRETTTRERLLSLADKLKVYGGYEKDMSPDDIVDDMRSRLLFEPEPLDPPGGAANVFSVSFDAEDPELASKFVNELVALVLSRNARVRTDRAEDTTQFFSAEVERLGAELKRLEVEILAFKNEHQDALPDSLDFRRNKQSALQERLLMLEREKTELRSRRSNLVLLYSSTGQIGGGAALSPEQQQLQDLNRALSEQSAIFSETSPAVAALRTRIEAVQGQLRARQENGADQKSGVSALDLQLSDIDQRLASIDREEASMAREVDALSKAIEATPANETTLNALERDRTNVQTQYNAAVARLADASTGEQIEVLSKGPRFTVLEPATAPQYPVSPHRRRIAALAGVAGIGLGFGFIILLEMLNQTVRRPQDLVRMFQAQPLATVPYVTTVRELRRANLKRGLALLLAAGVTAALMLAIHYYVTPLGLLLERLKSA